MIDDVDDGNDDLIDPTPDESPTADDAAAEPVKRRVGRPPKYTQQEGDLVLKTQVAEMRRDGLTFKTIARKVGVEEQRLGQWVREWVKDALDLHPDSGQYILDLSLSRYEELYRKVFAAVMKADEKKMDSQAFARLARLVMDIIKAECVLVARGGGFDADAQPFTPEDIEGEAKRLGVKMSD